MAMPNFGTLYLCNPSFVSVCRSIAHVAYNGSPPSSVSLRSAGLNTGFSGNISHSCFYGYAAPTITLTVSPSDVTFFSGGGTQSITVTASVGNSWTATSNESWATVGSGSGSGNGSFTIQTSSFISLDFRSAIITISSSISARYVEVTQFGYS